MRNTLPSLQTKFLFSVSVSKIGGTVAKENNGKSEVSPNSKKTALTSERESGDLLVCPEKLPRFPLFPFPCDLAIDCSIMGPKMVCCSNQCTKGVLPINKVVESKEEAIRRNDAPIPKPKPQSDHRKINVPNNIKLSCPGNDSRIALYSLPCMTNNDCSVMGTNMICCSHKCTKGVTQPVVESKQSSQHLDAGKKGNTIHVSEIILPTSTQKVTTSLPQKTLLVCPGKGVRIPFFSMPCAINGDCSIIGKNMVCCSNRCIKGVAPQKLEQKNTHDKATSGHGVDKREEEKILSENSLNSVITTASPSLENPNYKIIDNLPEYSILVCPGKEVRIPFFSYPCTENSDCLRAGTKMMCCSNRCIKGVPAPKPEVKHAPSWFGLVERQCPVDPIAEILEIKECETDADCSPRICCPDKIRNGSGVVKAYCRTAQPSLDRFPVANRLMEPFRVAAGYLQCTPPPPPVLDLFPKVCKNSLDCFPNLCCQEGDKKYCRPPKRSLLSFVAGVGQRLVPSDAARKLIERLN